MSSAQAAHLPGFRRRFRITPLPGHVTTEVEDDYHCMSVSVSHDAITASTVKADLARAPWSTCPGAVAQCETTFSGVALAEFPARGEKTSNCTHLYDLALLAAAHALDSVPMVYDIFVSDPVDGKRQAEIQRDGLTVLKWSDSNFHILEPLELEGMPLLDMREWIASLDGPGQEAARLLRWGSVIAHGRTIPMAKQSDASRMPPNCYSFQPEQSVRARRIGEVRDFSDGTIQPLERVGEML
ncbi:MAG: hypothetical protein OEW92_05065 [Gammaproteobacteria bacterium]|nr:hypothetical protein [Gammaproteobacteria bacterium]MDH5171766.1 hypothetical protein [Gammaproteobacteria bacterium]